jgi:hypothetical protein
MGSITIAELEVVVLVVGFTIVVPVVSPPVSVIAKEKETAVVMRRSQRKYFVLFIFCSLK